MENSWIYCRKYHDISFQFKIKSYSKEKSVVLAEKWDKLKNVVELRTLINVHAPTAILFLTNKFKVHIGKRQHFKQIVVRNLNFNMQKLQRGSYNSSCTKQLQINQGLQHKTWYPKTHRGKSRDNAWTHKHR